MWILIMYLFDFHLNIFFNVLHIAYSKFMESLFLEIR